MAEQKRIYRCNVCGNIVEVLHAGAGELVCCGQPMELLQEKNSDVGLEKHVPVLETTNSGTTVKVGEVPHPMEAEHYIEWVELLADAKACRQFLQPGDAPEAMFHVEAAEVSAREHCNKHGLWKGWRS